MAILPVRILVRFADSDFSRVVDFYLDPRVEFRTRLAPNSRSVGLVVDTGAVALVALLPVLAAVPSTGFDGSAPLYSKIRTSGKLAALVNVIVTVLVPAAKMLFA